MFNINTVNYYICFQPPKKHTFNIQSINNSIELQETDNVTPHSLMCQFKEDIFIQDDMPLYRFPFDIQNMF